MRHTICFLLLLTTFATVRTSAKTLIMKQSGSFEDAATPTAEAVDFPPPALSYNHSDVAENEEDEDYDPMVDDNYEQDLRSEEEDSDLSELGDQIEEIEKKTGVKAEVIEEEEKVGVEEVEDDNAELTTDPDEVAAGSPNSEYSPESSQASDGPIIVPEVRWTEGRGVLAGLPPTAGADAASAASPQSASLSGSNQGPEVEQKERPADLISGGREVHALEREQPAWEEEETEANVLVNIEEPERDYIEKFLNEEGDYESVDSGFVDTANPLSRSRPSWPQRNLTALGSRPRHPACHQSLDRGVGPEEFSSWYYDPNSRSCLWFPYYGHGGNANRFYTRTACQDLCVFDKSDLCESVECNYRHSRCVLMGDDSCRTYIKNHGKDVDSFCPPNQPVCQTARRSIFPPSCHLTKATAFTLDLEGVERRILPPECTEPLDHGNCDQKPQLSRYYYSEENNSCLFFLFRGCGGNNNRFISKSQCMNHCAV